MTIRGHVPVRTCVVCGKRRPKADLTRMAIDPASGLIVLDDNQRMEGRGAYGCPSCLPKVRFNRRVQKAFRNKAKGLADLQLVTHGVQPQVLKGGSSELVSCLPDVKI